MDDQKRQEYGRRLAAEAGALEAEDRDTEAARAPVELDQQAVGRLSRMDALQVQAMAMAEARRRTARRARIRAALARLETEEFGFCQVCGEPIAARRLDLDPTVATCIGCARAG